jgi:hypothetical protein
MYMGYLLLQKPIVSSKNAVLHAELLYKKEESLAEDWRYLGKGKKAPNRNKDRSSKPKF